MSLFEFDEEYYMDLFKEEYLQEGMQIGMRKGRQEGISQGIDTERIQGVRSALKMLTDVGLSGKSAITKIAETYHLSENEIRRILSEVPDKH